MADSATVTATAFVRHRGDVLVCRRDESASRHPAAWDGVSTTVGGDADPLAELRRVLRATVGSCDLALERRGEPLTADDGRGDTVHPFLFALESVASRAEIGAGRNCSSVEWISPPELFDRETVPSLWERYRRVAPTVETVVEDTTHGSTWLSYRALEVLRDRAAEGAAGYDGRDLRHLAVALFEARASMVVVSNRISRAVASAGGPGNDPGAIRDAATTTLRDAVRDDELAADRALERVEAALELATDETRPTPAVATLSRSGTVSGVLGEIDAPVVVAESRPGAEGTAVAADLATRNERVTLCSDAALSARVLAGDVACGLVGADRLLPDGSVINKVGTVALALACDRAGSPLVVAAASDKVAPGFEWTNQTRPSTDVYDGDAPVSVENPVFDRTPGDLVTVVTEDGVLEADVVEAIADRHRERADLLVGAGTNDHER